MTTLENDEQANQPTPPPLHEKEDIENFEKNEEMTAYDDEAKIEASKELENELATLEDEGLRK